MYKKDSIIIYTVILANKIWIFICDWMFYLLLKPLKFSVQKSIKWFWINLVKYDTGFLFLDIILTIF